jgi:hypothetical protein
MAELNIARAIYADMAPPADAIGDVDPWSDYDEDLSVRMFTSWRHPAVGVVIVGLSIQRWQRRAIRHVRSG